MELLSYVSTVCPENCLTCKLQDGRPWCLDTGCRSRFAALTAKGTCHSKLLIPFFIHQIHILANIFANMTFKMYLFIVLVIKFQFSLKVDKYHS